MEESIDFTSVLQKFGFICLYDNKQIFLYRNEIFNIFININRDNQYIDVVEINSNTCNKFYSDKDLFDYLSLHPLFKMEKFPPQNV